MARVGPLLRDGEDPLAVCEEAMTQFLSGREGMKRAEAWLFRFMDTEHAPRVLQQLFCDSKLVQVRAGGEWLRGRGAAGEGRGRGGKCAGRLRSTGNWRRCCTGRR
jgi:hypothetical protein